MKIYLDTLDTPIGNIMIASTDKGLCYLTWNIGTETDESMKKLARVSIMKILRVNNVQFMDDGCKHINAAKTELNEYFSGELNTFTVQIDLQTAGTEFQRTVWSMMKDIPYGKTNSYSDIASSMGKKEAARAVGSACARNPLPVIIPCHRVLSSTGKIGGYSAPGGLKTKEFLLELEKSNTRK